MEVATKIFKPEVLKTFNFPIEREPLSNSRESDTGFDNIYNAKSGQSLGVVSRGYKLITHQEAIFQVLEGFKKQGLPKVEPVRIRTSAEGARMWAEFRFVQKKLELDLGRAVENPKVGDLVVPGFKIANSYDRSIKYGLNAYLLRLICTNGATVTERLYSESRRHFGNFEIPDLIEGFVNQFGNFEKKVFPAIRSLNKQLVSPVDLQKELNEVPGWLQDETLDYLSEHKFIRFKETNGDTEVEMVKEMSSWNLLNSYTYVLSHSENVSEEKRSELSREVSERFGL